MVELLVFYLHIVGATAVFVKRFQEEGITEGVLAVLFVILIFFVGWSMTSFIMKLFMEPEGFGRFFSRDAASLVLLTAAECVLYYFYFRRENGGEQPLEEV